MLVLKAVSKRHDREFNLPCSGPHAKEEPATWDLDIALVGKLQLCTSHYHELTEWECGNERKCNHINYGMATRCGVCGWVRPDTCGKCGEWSTVPLIKITEERAPHKCHTCNGDTKERGLVPCGSCNGNAVVSEQGCVTCYGSGRMMERDQMCPGCNGSGQSRSICRICKGAGEVTGWSNSACTTCKGTGICRASSANWGIGRIPLTDIAPEHRDTLKPHVGQYLCFRCANPDFQFTPYRNDRTPLQCSHVEDKPDGLVRCANDVARNNPGKFCFAHSNSNQCSVCRKRLELDESGGRCRKHAKCGCCNDVPVEGSLFCPSHQEYKALGRMLEKQTSPESPPQILKAREEVAKSREKLDRRCDESLERSKEISDQIIKLEQTQHEIIANDPQINQWRRDEIMKIEVEIAGLDKTPEGKEKEAKLRKEIEQLEQEINEGRDDRESILIGKLSVKIDGLRQEMAKVLADYVRCQHIGKELLEVSERLQHLQRYELWEREKGRTPEYVGTPLMVSCKKCTMQFNVRTPNKWLCPHCTTVSHIEVWPAEIEELKADNEPHPHPGKWLEWFKSVEDKGNKAAEAAKAVKSVEDKQAEAIKAFRKTANAAKAAQRRRKIVKLARITSIALPTDNTPEYEHKKELICEICRKDVKELKYVPLLLRPRYRASDNDFEVPSLNLPEGHTKPRGIVYLVCPSCAFWESGPGNMLREERRLAIETDLLKKESEKTRLDYYFADLAKSILGKQKAQIIVSDEDMRERPKPFPLPPMESVSGITEARKAAAKKELAGQTAVALERFKVLIAKDETSIEELIEMGRLRSIILKTYKEVDLPKKVVEKEVVVPPPPPSQWLR